ncbi:MAG: MoaD/ThiS family protein [Acidobacteria bacterium]|nr:MoaD/ThiS family protein [Acidobacteriota bacterium]
MQVRVLYFGALREAAGRADEFLTLVEDSTAAEIIVRVRERLSHSTELLSRSAIAVNQTYVLPSEPLHDGDEVALLPPVSGGAPSLV